MQELEINPESMTDLQKSILILNLIAEKLKNKILDSEKTFDKEVEDYVEFMYLHSKEMREQFI